MTVIAIAIYVSIIHVSIAIASILVLLSRIHHQTTEYHPRPAMGPCGYYAGALSMADPSTHRRLPL